MAGADNFVLSIAGQVEKQDPVPDAVMEFALEQMMKDGSGEREMFEGAFLWDLPETFGKSERWKLIQLLTAIGMQASDPSLLGHARIRVWYPVEPAIRERFRRYRLRIAGEAIRSAAASEEESP
ncbi:hypothetical protein EBT31_11385 [bacterium]|nr:hypothetical protein [bacterium]